ncbi:MAG: SET domain-containing protein-lysine N-methyltransferase [Pseudomonadales bacterium]
MVISPSIRAFIDSYAGPTPHLVVSTDVVEEKYLALVQAMPDARHHYAIKANPDNAILKRLVGLGCSFECASIPEIDMCIEAGALAENILYGNPLKKASEIKAAVERGVEQFVFDAELELLKLVEHAPGAKVICRITTDGKGAVSPLSIKFGCPSDRAIGWLKQAQSHGLVPYGVSFHVGSQQLAPTSWRAPIADAAEVFKAVAAVGIDTMTVLDIGGGFPVSYREAVLSIADFGRAINDFIETSFGSMQPLVYTEPGRYMAGDAGVVIAEVVLIAPSYSNPDVRWVYLDIGRYGGLVESQIDYPILCERDGESGPVILAGQTCDSNDVIYPEGFRYHLPLSLECGDRVLLANTGVYTTTYSTTLNGFPTLSSECISEKSPQKVSVYPEEFIKAHLSREANRALLPTDYEIVKNETEEFGVGIFACRAFSRGEVIAAFIGEPVTEVVQHSLQRSPGDQLLDPFFSGYLLHSCDPNAVLDMHEQKLYCLRDIALGEPLLIDYAVTEDHLFAQFECRCGAPNCRSWITGRHQAVNEEGRLFLEECQRTYLATLSLEDDPEFQEFMESESFADPEPVAEEADLVQRSAV